MSHLDKIGALLRQAESTDNEAERQAFFAKAQQLATQSQIDLEIARQHQSNKEKRETPIKKHVTIGQKGERGLSHRVRLYSAIARNNDLKLDVAHNSTYVILYGFPSDIEVAELLYDSILVQMVSESDKYIKSGVYKEELVRVERYEKEYDPWLGKNQRFFVGYDTKPLDGRVARNNFLEAYVNTISVRLSEARQSTINSVENSSIEEYDTNSTHVTSAALVLQNKGVEVVDFHKSMSNARGSWKGGGSKGYSSAAQSAGRAAGQRARLSAQRGISR